MQKDGHNNAIVRILEYVKTVIEADLEEAMVTKERYTQGLLPVLRTIDQDRWGDKQTVDIHVEQQIQVVLPTGGKLRQRMINAGVDVPALPAPDDT